MQNQYPSAIMKILKEKKIEAGGRIAVKKEGSVFEGALMPAAELGMLVIKLDNGYNIGVKLEKGAEVERIDKQKQ